MRFLPVALSSVAASVLALTSVASAADIPARPAYKAPAPVAAFYNWSGIYIGGHAGWGWGESDVTNVNGTPPFPAGTQSSNDFDGFFGGVQAGVNWQWSPNWVVGVEGDFSWSAIDGTSEDPSTVPAFVGIRTTTTNNDIDWLATVTGRIGYAMNTWLLYVKGGAAWAHFESDSTTINPATGALIATTVASSTRSGWTVGAGAEWALWQGWTAKAEYGYLDFGSDTINRTVTFDSIGTIPNPLIRDVDTHMHVVKFGINHRFNWGGPVAP